MFRSSRIASLPAPLRHKLDQALMVVEEALDTYPPEAMLVAWSAGKDSTLVLALVLEVCRQRRLQPPRALDIDQRDQFPELEVFRDAVARDWGVELMIVGNHDVLAQVERIGDPIVVGRLNAANRQALNTIGIEDTELPWTPDSPLCNHLLKTVPITEAIATHGIQALFTGIRWDEHGARDSETYFSPRQQPPHVRVHPILHFTERDIWDITFALDIPFSDLYHLGYRSLGTRSGTHKAANIPAWQQDLENSAERGGRNAEKEKMMAQLRDWGYL